MAFISMAFISMAFIYGFLSRTGMRHASFTAPFYFARSKVSDTELMQ
jgi:hypothetical protein